MARVIDTYDFSFAINSTGKYPWKTWFNGQIWVITKGEDFEIQPANFRSTALSVAKKVGYDLKVAIEGDDVILQAKRKPGRPKK